MLRDRLKKRLFKHQEGRLLDPWRACSRMVKGVFLLQVGPFL